jgi:hypothetical protein
LSSKTQVEPHAIVQVDSEAEKDLIKVGWELTDSYPDGRRHYEPPESKKELNGMEVLYRKLLKIRPDATCIRTYDRSYGMEVCFVLPSGEEMMQEEFLPYSETKLWFYEVHGFLKNNPHIGSGDFS